MQTFPIEPAGMRPLWVLLPVALVLALVAGLLVRSVFASSTATFEVSADGLRLRGDFYGRLIPIAELHPTEARVVDLTLELELRPSRRTLGTGLPGYSSGWFRLKNGERALLYLTERRRAVYVPTRAGYSLLLSPQDPDGFLAALRAVGAARPKIPS